MIDRLALALFDLQAALKDIRWPAGDKISRVEMHLQGWNRPDASDNRYGELRGSIYAVIGKMSGPDEEHRIASIVIKRDNTYECELEADAPYGISRITGKIMGAE